MRHRIMILLLSILSLSCSGCAIYHHYGPYYGKIIDEETKRPLEGVVILADYYTWLHASPGGPGVYFLDTQEIVTDKNGEFKIPSLNAFAFRPFSTFNSYPGFTIFKPQYKCFTNRLTEGKYEMVALKNLKNREERINNTGCFPGIVPNSKMKRLIEVNNIESVELGLQPSHVRETAK